MPKTPDEENGENAKGAAHVVRVFIDLDCAAGDEVCLVKKSSWRRRVIGCKLLRCLCPGNCLLWQASCFRCNWNLGQPLQRVFRTQDSLFNFVRGACRDCSTD